MANNNYQNVPSSTIARDLRKLEKGTDNIYESIAIISKRANQIGAQLKEELHAKLDEFNNDSDSMHYERIPKPTLIATEEFLDDKIHFRNPEKEKRLAEGN
jgi:DNA-directed RNA polymerase subunit K/omega